MSPQLTWYVARGAGVVAWALAAAAVVWGLALSTRVAGRRPSPAWLADLHRFLGGLAVTFTGVHVAALLLDDWVRFTIADMLIPFVSQWRPAAVAWGVVAAYLLVAIEVTSLLRRRLPVRWWRAVHLTSFGLFVAATAHVVMAGTDAGSWWLRTLVITAVGAVVFLTVVRILSPRPARRRAASRSRPTVPAARGAPVRSPGRSDDAVGDARERVTRIHAHDRRVAQGVDLPGQ